MTWKTALAAACLVAATLPALADDPAAPATKEASTRRERAARRDEDGTIRFHGTTWHRGVQGALAENERARASQRRPVFFVRMLGELDGKT